MEFGSAEKCDVVVRRQLFRERPKTYRVIGYAPGEAPLGYEEPIDEPVVEYEHLQKWMGLGAPEYTPLATCWRGSEARTVARPCSRLCRLSAPGAAMVK